MLASLAFVVLQSLGLVAGQEFRIQTIPLSLQQAQHCLYNNSRISDKLSSILSSCSCHSFTEPSNITSIPGPAMTVQPKQCIGAALGRISISDMELRTGAPPTVNRSAESEPSPASHGN